MALRRRLLLRSAVALALFIPGRVLAEPATAPREAESESASLATPIQELILATPCRLQEPGEVQVTASFDCGRGADGWGSGLEAEFGIASWIQLGSGVSFTSSTGEARAVDAEVLLAASPGASPWRAAAGIGYEAPIETTDESGSADLRAFLGYLGRPIEFHLETGVRRTNDRTVARTALAAAWGHGRLVALIEGQGLFESMPRFLVSPGIAWHPVSGLELVAGLPLRVAGDDVPDAAIVLKTTVEWEVGR